MRNLMKWASTLTVLSGLVCATQAHALPVVNTDNLQLSVGGLIQVMGEGEYVSDDSVGNKFRLYVWNVADSLYASGTYKGLDWRIATIYGGTTNAASTSFSNGFLDLTDAYVDIPLIENAMYLKVGQFKDPTNLESATDSSYMLFTEKSPNFNFFFNSGYEMGLAMVGHFGGLDGALGLVQGVPNLPQRFLPEQLNLPLPMFLRVGYSNGISDDPFHPRQTGFAKVEDLQYAIHLNGFVAADSNAGHGDLFGEMGGGLKTFLYNQDYNGNVLLSSVFNPYMGVAGSGQPLNALYYQAGLDFQVRAPLSNGKIFALGGQAAMGHFGTTVQSGDTGTVLGVPVVTGNSYGLNIFGGMLIASLQDPTWTWAVRLAMVIPDSGFQGTWTTGTYAQIFSNTNPIWEVTPSVTYTFSQFVKLTAEVMLMFNEPEAVDSDGNYVIAEMPGLATGTSYASSNISAFVVPIGRLMLQCSF
jgi:Phosphate-selective porin O and P